MTDARRGSFWHRAGPIAALGALLVSAATTEGCSCGDNGSANGGGGATSSSSSAGGGTTSSTGTMGTGGTGGTNQGGGGTNPGTLQAKQVSNDPASFASPFDATPDPAGTSTMYFTGLDTAGLPGVFKVPMGGGSVTTISKGPPLVTPFGIATSSDGSQLYVADPGGEPGSTDRGVIWSMGTALDQTPMPVNGSGGKSARSLVLTVENNADVLYFTGFDDAAGEAAVYKLATNGGMANKVVGGAPMRDPSGIAVAANGDLYVADTVGSTSHEAQIVKIHNGAASPWVTDLKVNYPAGVALTKDGKTLLVSSLDPDANTDVIVQIDVATKTETDFTHSGSVNLTTLIEAAGMHRAVSSNVFGWVDSAAGDMSAGTVYSLKFVP
ncbi:MAG TPA: hypothetical protein VHB21_09735 [Minicystis sp.]|nr:hypothetical protein [Minicystis sp.]